MSCQAMSYHVITRQVQKKRPNEIHIHLHLPGICPAPRYRTLGTLSTEAACATIGFADDGRCGVVGGDVGRLAFGG
jgi:hypothetical protein